MSGDIPTRADDGGTPPSIRLLSGPTAADLAALAELFDRYRVHYGEGSDVSRTASWLEQHVRTGRMQAFVAEDGTGLVGFATTVEVPASLQLARVWQVRDLFVVPERRRTGVGRALLAAVRTGACAAGATRLVLQTEEANDAALRLYTVCGYTPIDGYRALVLEIGPAPAAQRQ